MKKVVVFFFGGMDLVVVIVMVQEQGFVVYVLSVCYGQCYIFELDVVVCVVKVQGVVVYKIVDVDLCSIGGLVLIDDIDVLEVGGVGILVIYVLVCNIIMLLLVLGWVEVFGVNDIFCGVNVVDYFGYFDCCFEFVVVFQVLVNLVIKFGVEGVGIKVYVLLQFFSKGQIVSEGVCLGVDFGLIVFCYNVDVNGVVCGYCDVCWLCVQGFVEVGVFDFMLYV